MRRPPTFFALLVGLLLVAAACSGDDDGDQEAIDAYCTRAGALRGISTVFDPTTVDPLDPEALQAAFDQVRVEIESALEVAPDEISDDLELSTASALEGFARLDAVGYDFTQLTESDVALFTEVDPEVAEAIVRIERFDAVTCDLGAPGATSTPGPFDDEPSEAGETTGTEGEGEDGTEAEGEGGAEGEGETEGGDDGEPTPTAPSQVDIAGELRDEIIAAFSEREIGEALDFVGLETVEELAVAIAAGEVDLAELDEFFQRRAEGVPLVYGDDVDLDILWDACGDDDWPACDALYEVAPLRSAYERFAATCAGTSDDPIGGRCEATFG